MSHFNIAVSLTLYSILNVEWALYVPWSLRLHFAIAAGEEPVYVLGINCTDNTLNNMFLKGSISVKQLIFYGS